MVFYLTVSLALRLPGQGFGVVIGDVGNFASVLGLNTGTAPSAAQTATSVQPGDAARGLATARDAASVGY
jgi:hypothetical protein